MNSENWRNLGLVAPEDLIDARNALHKATQWPSRVARGALAAAEDDSHSNLGWHDPLAMLVSHDLGNGRVLGLSLTNLSLNDVRNGKTVSHLDLTKHNTAEIIAWLTAVIDLPKFNPDALSAALPYTLPDDVTNANASGIAPHALQELNNWFANCADILGDIAAAEPAASDVRCWPHHFDIATLITLAGHGEDATTIGVGMSPGDEGYAEPYLYVTPWPYPEGDILPRLPAIGHWHQNGYVAAIAPASKIIVAGNQHEAVDDFLSAAIAACRKLHST